MDIDQFRQRHFGVPYDRMATIENTLQQILARLPYPITYHSGTGTTWNVNSTWSTTGTSL